MVVERRYVLTRRSDRGRKLSALVSCTPRRPFWKIVIAGVIVGAGPHLELIASPPSTPPPTPFRRWAAEQQETAV